MLLFVIITYICSHNIDQALVKTDIDMDTRDLVDGQQICASKFVFNLILLWLFTEIYSFIQFLAEMSFSSDCDC